MRRLGRFLLWLLAAIGAVFVLFVLWLIATGPLFRVGARFEFKVAKDMNSGVQFRSKFFDKPTEYVDAKETDEKKRVKKMHRHYIDMHCEMKKQRQY